MCSGVRIWSDGNVKLYVLHVGGIAHSAVRKWYDVGKNMNDAEINLFIICMAD